MCNTRQCLQLYNAIFFGQIKRKNLPAYTLQGPCVPHSIRSEKRQNSNILLKDLLLWKYSFEVTVLLLLPFIFHTFPFKGKSLLISITMQRIFLRIEHKMKFMQKWRQEKWQKGDKWLAILVKSYMLVMDHWTI